MSDIYKEQINPIKIEKGKGAINRYVLYTNEGETVQFSYIVDAQEALAIVDEDGNHKYFIEKPKNGKIDKQKETKANVAETKVEKDALQKDEDGPDNGNK